MTFRKHILYIFVYFKFVEDVLSLSSSEQLAQTIFLSTVMLKYFSMI